MKDFVNKAMAQTMNWIRKRAGHKCKCVKCGSKFVATESLDLCMGCKVAELLEYADKILYEDPADPKIYYKSDLDYEEDEDTHRPEDY